MIRKTVLLLATALLSLPTMAVTISESEAEQAALRFVNRRSHTGGIDFKSIESRQLQKAALEMRNIYGFNISGGGYVLVSGDDRCYEILGYSDSGSLNLDEMPAAMRAWLAGYNEAIAEMQSKEIEVRSESTPLGAAIEPLLKTEWYQMAPYNNLCPVAPGSTDGASSPTGCVCTAMAQVMYYFRWPESECAEIPGYTFNNPYGSMEMPALPSVKFDWDNMLPGYKNCTASDVQNNAVAILMQYCGSALKTIYYPKMSDGREISIATALRSYFGYGDETRCVKRFNYSVSQWEKLIYNELANGRPVPYAGESGDSGHSFVCDGYDGAGLFHINWGWEGNDDGYFRLSVLNPFDNISVGSSSSLMGYTYDQQAVIGIAPSKNPSTNTEDTFFSLPNVMTIDGNKVKITYFYESLHNPQARAEIALGIASGDEFTPLFSSGIIDVDQNIAYNYSSVDIEIDPLSLSEGETRLKPMARVEGGEWLAMAGDETLVLAVKKGDDVSLKVLPEVSLSISRVYFSGDEQPQLDKPAEITIVIDNKGEEFNGVLDIYVYELGGETIDNLDLSSVPQWSCDRSGLYVRSGETDSIAIKYASRTPGNLAILLYRDAEFISKANLWLEADDVPFYDFQVGDYNVSLDDMGFLNYSVTIYNNDSRSWAFPKNTNTYMRLSVNDDKDKIYTTMYSHTSVVSTNVVDAGEDCAEATLKIEQVIGGTRAQTIFEATVKAGESLSSGIDRVVDDADTPAVWHNLQGIEISEPSTPGIYIRNNKKVILK